MKSEGEYIFRSLMFVPGHNEKLLIKAASTDADVLLIDLEDSVRPDSNKQLARKIVKEKIETGLFKNYQVFPRVNDRESGHLIQDIYELTIEGVDGFTYPKAQTGQDIYFFDKLLETIEAEKRIPKGTFKIIALIETAGAVLNAQEICQASSRLVAIAFGCEDFISDLGGIHDNSGDTIFTARAIIAMAAKANKIIPIDTVHVDVHNLEDLEKNLKTAKKLGFEGMLILNPKELELAHKYFSPTEKEIREAEEMLLLFNESAKAGKGVAIKDGKFIGPPMVISAQKTLEKARIIKNKRMQNG